MERAMMAFPELRHPFEESEIHPPGSATLLYGGRSITLDDIGPGDGLLIAPEDLVRVNGFEVKPEGACFESICIPLDQSIQKTLDGRSWFDLLAFADRLGQPYVADVEHRVFSFAEIPDRRQRMLTDAMAPEFEVTDRSGNVVTLADLKGKKALIVTWSSW